MKATSALPGAPASGPRRCGAHGVRNSLQDSGAKERANEIEAELTRRGGYKDYVPFAEMVRKSPDLATAQADLLRKWAELRNVIVHTPRGGKPEYIADPREDIVEAIERQLDLLIRPPGALTVLRSQPPRVLAASDDIGVFLGEVALPHDFSQSPVRMADGSLPLITTNAFTRWVAESYEPGGAILESATVAEVLAFREPGDAIKLEPRTLTAVRAWRIFSGELGIAPAAIAVTNSGKSSESPLGLIVKADVPELLRSLGV